MTNHYKFGQMELLIYNVEAPLPEAWQLELVTEDVDPSDEKYRHLPLFERESFFFGALGKRTRDRVLEEEGIISFDDLSNAYFLYMNKLLKKPVRIREFVKEKYSEIIELVKDGHSEDNEIR